MKLEKIGYQLTTSPFATIFASVLTTFVVAFLFFRLAGPVPISVTQTTVEKKSTFDVSAEEKVVAIPDTAKVSLGVQVQKPSVSQAQNEANKKINQIKKSLQELGIKEEKIKTTRYDIYPNYNFREGRKIIGYTLNVVLEVKTKDFEKLNQVIDAATSLGANQIGGLTFTIDEELLEELKMEARKKAIEKGIKKAKEIAKAGNLRLGKIVNISENITSPYLPSYSKELVGLEKTSEEETETRLSPGESEVKASITLSYEIL